MAHATEALWETMLVQALRAARGSNVEAGCSFATVYCDDEADDDQYYLPDITVDGVGRLSLPLAQAQAAQLLAAGEAAPFGKGMATVLDPAVRRATQLDAAKVHFGEGWEETLSDITTECALDLGLDEHRTDHVSANLYKLLLYEPGGHFAAHRDTEKEPGMFATLVVQLPVAGGHAGGVLTVRHGREYVTWESERGSSTCSDLQYAAFFADCEHELSAVTAGLRVVLVYNLVLQGQGAPVRVPAGGGTDVVERLQAAVRAWERAAEEGHGEAAAPLVTLALEHKYTETNRSFRGLKGHDARLVGLLQQCGGLELHLALVTKRISGTAEDPYCDYRYRRHKRYRRSWYDSDESNESDEYDDGASATMLEVHDFDLTSSDLWVSESGHKVDYTSLEADLHEALLPGEWRFEEGSMEEEYDPDERLYEAYTGNAGPTLEFVYHRAVVVLWPRACRWRVALSGGLGPSLDLLDRKVAEVARGGGAAAAAGEQAGQQGGAGVAPAAVQEAVGLLRGVTGLVIKGPGRSSPQSYCSWSPYGTVKSYDSLVARALRLAVSPAVCGVAAAAGGSGEAVAVHMVGGLERNGVGLGSGTAMVDALAAVSATLASTAFDDAVVRLVRAAGTRHVGQAAALAAGVRYVPQAAALRQGMGQQHTAGGGGEGKAVAPLGLRVRVAEALMESTVGSTEAFKKLAAADVLLLARMAYGGAAGCTTEAGLDEQVLGCYAGYGERFVRAVEGRRDGQELLKALLAEGVVRGAVQRRHPAALSLVAPRLRVLQAVKAAGRPVFPGWEQPEAHFPSDQQVQAFLRGPQMQATFTGMFSGIAQARNWVSTYFGGHRSAPSAAGYSATAEASGIGRKACVTVTKTRPMYEKAVQQYKKDRVELADIEALLGTAGAGVGVGAGGGAMGAVGGDHGVGMGGDVGGGVMGGRPAGMAGAGGVAGGAALGAGMGGRVDAGVATGGSVGGGVARPVHPTGAAAATGRAALGVAAPLGWQQQGAGAMAVGQPAPVHPTGAAAATGRAALGVAAPLGWQQQGAGAMAVGQPAPVHPTGAAAATGRVVLDLLRWQQQGAGAMAVGQPAPVHPTEAAAATGRAARDLLRCYQQATGGMAVGQPAPVHPTGAAAATGRVALDLLRRYQQATGGMAVGQPAPVHPTGAAAATGRVALDLLRWQQQCTGGMAVGQPAGMAAAGKGVGGAGPALQPVLQTAGGSNVYAVAHSVAGVRPAAGGAGAGGAGAARGRGGPPVVVDLTGSP